MFSEWVIICLGVANEHQEISKIFLRFFVKRYLISKICHYHPKLSHFFLLSQIYKG